MDLIKTDRRRRPVMFVMLGALKDLEDPRFLGEVVLGVGQQVRDRLLLTPPDMLPTSTFPNFVEQAPHLILLHTPGWRARPPLRLTGQMEVFTGCKQIQHLVLSQFLRE